MNTFRERLTLGTGFAAGVVALTFLIGTAHTAPATVRTSKATQPPARVAPDTSAIANLRADVERLRNETERQKVARDYFTTTLTTQTAIFTAILFAALGAGWVTSNQRVKGVIDKEMKNALAALEAKSDNLRDELNKSLDDRHGVTDRKMRIIDSRICRTMGHVRGNNSSAAYRWFLRAAVRFDGDSTRSDLELAIKHLQAVTASNFRMKEVNFLLSSLDQKKYELELKILRENVERVYRAATGK